MIDYNDVPPVQEYEEKISMNKNDFRMLQLYPKNYEWEDFNPCKQEEYKDLWIEEKKTNKELRHTKEVTI